MTRFMLSMLILMSLNSATQANFFKFQTLAKVESLKNIAYGDDSQQMMDIYFPSKPHTDNNLAPIIVMVHGGAWSIGDKNNAAVVKNKVDYWGKRGWLLISVNYRLVPTATVQQQTQDISNALLYIQKHANDWHANSKRLILVGHSAGAHLVSLVTVRPSWLTPQPQPWRATIALDSAAYDIEKIMQNRHARFYDRAFGQQPENWKALSPILQLHQSLPAFLAVCSTTRPDQPCIQAQQFIQQAQKLGTSAQLLSLPLSHREINRSLGEDNAYTQQVNQFIQSH